MIKDDIEARDFFLHTLEWLAAVMDRYPGYLYFGLVLVSYASADELGKHFGAKEAVRQLGEVGDSLKDILRKTDLIARDGTDFWILTPYTPANETIRDKVLSTVQALPHQELGIVERDVSIFALPIDLGPASLRQKPEDLLRYLKANRQAMASHFFRLSLDQSTQPPASVV
ncbi:GGDEF domain-containing protein [Burkholderiaceae bacterium DAT-1]|nr:GGDEF domain-containing protein [Burkholderiaceae bacterium DAT-1]